MEAGSFAEREGRHRGAGGRSLFLNIFEPVWIELKRNSLPQEILKYVYFLVGVDSTSFKNLFSPLSACIL